MTTDVFTPKVKLEHVISFSDAVFAFAITLMAISIDIPDLPTNLTQSQLLGKLYEMYPQVESYLISFAVIAIFWISYHQVFNHIMGSPIQIVYLNLLFLMFITLLSLSTSLVINYGSYQIPYIVYCTHCNNDKFYTCSYMVVCNKRSQINKQEYSSTFCERCYDKPSFNSCSIFPFNFCIIHRSKYCTVYLVGNCTIEHCY